MKFFEKAPPTTIAVEVCGGSHHWARLLSTFGHEVKLIALQLAKPYIKRGKNDAADAEALCEAMSRPTMRFVPVETAGQQAALMLVGVRERLIPNRTQLANAIRGFAYEALVVGATALLQHVRAGRSKHASRWLSELLQRKKPKLVAVALANKIDRVAWKLMVSGETSRRTEGQTQAI